MLRNCIILLCCILSACSNMRATDKADEVRRVSTAKINTRLGMAYLERNEMSRAKQKLLLALKESPTSPEPWYAMAYYLEITGNKAEAERYYNQAISLAPHRGDTHNNYGTFLCREAQYEASIQQFLIATRDSDYLNIGAAYENAGLCALKIPNRERAIEYFEKAILQDPDRSISHMELAKLRNNKYPVIEKLKPHITTDLSAAKTKIRTETTQTTKSRDFAEEIRQRIKRAAVESKSKPDPVKTSSTLEFDVSDEIYKNDPGNTVLTQNLAQIR